MVIKMRISRRRILRMLGMAFGYMLLLMLIPRSIVRNHARGNFRTEKMSAGSVKKKSSVTRSPGKVAIVHCDSYASGVVYEAVKTSLAVVGFSVLRGKNVLLKPNIIAQYRPEQGATTHPAVVEAVCRYFTENGCAVTIGDSMAFYQGGGTAEALETTGMAGVAKKYGARLLPFESARVRKISTGRVLNPFYVSEAVFESDLVVNLPKMKVHRLARYTGAIKNMYGTVVGGSKQYYHTLFQSRPDYREFWGKPLVDVYEAVNPGLTVMDAVYGLDEDGPAANGKPRFTGLILASENGCALDVAACRVMGFDPRRVPALREALDRGLAHAEKVEISGDIPLIPYVKLPDEKPKTGLSKKLDDYLFDQFMVEPRLNKKVCTACGRCVGDCVPGAINLDKKNLPVFDYSQCIRCYCCEALCPEKAIFLHGSAVNHLIRGARYLMKI